MGYSKEVDKVLKGFCSAGGVSTCETGSEAGLQAIRDTDIARSKRWFLIGFLLTKNRNDFHIFIDAIIRCVQKPAKLLN